MITCIYYDLRDCIICCDLVRYDYLLLFGEI